jgi:hypothetical protein
MTISTYLFMCKSELMLEDGLPVAEELYFICEKIKIIGQGLGELIIIDMIKCHVCGRGWQKACIHHICARRCGSTECFFPFARGRISKPG